MVMKYRNCGQCLPVAEMSLDFMIYELCAEVQHERNLIIAMDIPNPLKDLFLEQSKILVFMKFIVLSKAFSFISIRSDSFSVWYQWICNVHRRNDGKGNHFVATCYIGLLRIF